MISLAVKAALVLGGIASVLCAESRPVMAGPQLLMPDGTKVEAATLPYFTDRPKILGYLQKIVDSKRESSMALAVTPAFCPSYSWTAWGGEDPVARASLKCQAKLDEQLSAAELPVSARLGCKCSLAVRNMTVLDADSLLRASRYTNVKLLIRNPGSDVQKRSGILEYRKNDLVKQKFALFNAQKVKICSGELEFKIGELGRFSGHCLGNNPIRDGGVMIGCPSGVFCRRHIVGNMKLDNGTVIGFASGLRGAEIARKYPDLPDGFAVEAAAEAPKEEEFDQ